jgi:ABC-2 type transport system ATP-binding protein
VLTTHYLEEADALADRIVVINRGSLIAQGTPGEIKARTAGKRIRCVTQLPIEVVRTIPGAQDVREDRDAFVIHTARPEEVLRQLLQLDLEISDIEVTSAGLEEAFLALTREDDAGSRVARA